MRRNKEAREALARRLAEAAVRLAERSRETGDVFIRSEIFSLPAPRGGDIEVLHVRSDALGLETVDILAPMNGRIATVFSARWEPFHVGTFRYGSWMDLLVPGSRGDR